MILVFLDLLVYLLAREHTGKRVQWSLAQNYDDDIVGIGKVVF